ETGLIVPIGRWVLNEACRQTVAWQKARGGAPLTISVNLSARQLERPELVDEVVAALEETGLDPRALVLEITESVVLEKSDDLVQRLNDLKRLGVRLAIDDFGTGYSSLSYLQRLPIDVLKVDKTFVDAVGSASESAALVGTIVQLAHTLRLQTVA